MAYAAVDCLIQTIERLHNPRSISIAPNSSPEIIRFLLDELFSLQLVLEKWSRKRINMEKVDDLDELIREGVSQLEQTLVSHVSNQFGLQDIGGQIHPFLFALDLEELKQGIDSFALTINELKKAYIDVLSKEEEGEEEADVGGGDDNVKIYESAMVGLKDEFVEIRDRLLNKSSPSFALFGMAGIGKTTLANKLFTDPLISSKFVTRAFVNIGPKYQLYAVLLDILKQVDPDQFHEKVLTTKAQVKLVLLKRTIFRSLAHQRYLIVLDDVWDEEVWDDLKPCFPNNKNGGSNKIDGSKVLLTTRLRQVAKVAHGHCKYHIRFLDKKESWHLLRQKVFGEEESSFSSELEKAGKKIAEYCEGLPLTILTVADIISKSGEKDSLVYWNEIASHKQNPVFTDAYDRMLTVLYPSYNYLPQQLKTSFLYIGVFPQNHEIHCSRLINLWRAEGFSGAHLDKTSEYCYNRLAELWSRSIVMIGNNKSDNRGKKTCTLHSSFWYLCNKEAAKNKLFYSLSTLDDVSAECLESQCRLSIRNNVLLGIKGAFDLIEPIPTVRSFLCTGPYHQYPVPVNMTSRFLKILDAITIRFYEFPVELLNLVQLTYLALTFNGKLPPDISQLWNLEFLIVHRHLSIIESDKNSSYLPLEIWDMQQLKHLQITGCNLLDPCYQCLLPFLSSLVDVGPQSCTKDILSRIPHLQKLGIRIESVPEDAVPLSCFDHISHLQGLRSFKCIVVNPEVKSKIVAPPVPISIFPTGLRKLSLSGLGYPWEEMTKISSLPNLRVLKLRCYAFRGLEWEVRDYEFQYLEYLLIEDSDLVRWTFPDYSGLYTLKSLSIKHCYNLQEIPRKLFAQRLKKIELVDCGSAVMTCAKEFKEDHGHAYGHVSQLVLSVDIG